MPVPFLYVYADSYQSWFHRFYRGRDTNMQIFMMKVQHISLPQAVYYIRLYTHTHTHTTSPSILTRIKSFHSILYNMLIVTYHW